VDTSKPIVLSAVPDPIHEIRKMVSSATATQQTPDLPGSDDVLQVLDRECGCKTKPVALSVEIQVRLFYIDRHRNDIRHRFLCRQVALTAVAAPGESPIYLLQKVAQVIPRPKSVFNG